MDSQLSPRCPIRTTLEMLGGKWRLLLINAIGQGHHRFGALKRAIPEISEKMLTQELKNLVDNRLITRTNYGEVPPRVEYHLTEMGQQAKALLRPISAFGLAYMEQLD